MFIGDEVTRTARKPHRCSWCAERIETGEAHSTWAGVCEDGWWRARLHVECVKPCREVLADGYDNEMPEPGIYGRGSTEER